MTGIPEGLFLSVLAAIGVVIWWGIRQIVTELKKINERLNLINGRVGKMETWKDMHEKQDDERHEHLEKATDTLWVAVRGQ